MDQLQKGYSLYPHRAPKPLQKGNLCVSDTTCVVHTGVFYRRQSVKLRLLFKRVDLITSRLKVYLISKGNQTGCYRDYITSCSGDFVFPQQEIPQRLALFVVSLVVLASLCLSDVPLHLFNKQVVGLMSTAVKMFTVRLYSNINSLLKTYYTRKVPSQSGKYRLELLMK